MKAISGHQDEALLNRHLQRVFLGAGRALKAWAHNREESEEESKILQYCVCLGFPGGAVVQSPPAKQETGVPSLGQEDPLEEERAIHSSILAW